MFCVAGLFDGPVTATVEPDIGWEDFKDEFDGGGLAAGTGGLLEAITGGGVFWGGADGGAPGVAPAALGTESFSDGCTEGSKTVPPVFVLEATNGGEAWICRSAGSF
jgi:hypothetical protein